MDLKTAGVVEGVELRHWTQPFPEVEPGEVVIEAFACELPERHLQVMARQQPHPVWINLEYLSAEDWVAGCHAMSSPHPRLPLVKHFFFPGFEESTGGLVREADLLMCRDAFRREKRAAWRARHGVEGVCVSLFAYEQPGLPALMQAWAESACALTVLVPESRVLGDVQRALGRPTLAVGERVRWGSLTVHILPFTDQQGYDEMLWACDLNFVRGEDSFVRAQWAGKPFVWQIYAQDEGAHFDKLDAFMARYVAGLDPQTAVALTRFWQAWNGHGEPAVVWPAFAAALPEMDRHAAQWCERLAAQADLSSRLTKFCSHIRASAG